VNAGAQFAAVILAAGASSRMGRPKPLLRFEGETFLDRLVGRFAGIAQPVRVVLGYGADQVRAGVAHGRSIEFVINPDPSRGMLSSLQRGLAGLPVETDGAFFMPVDLPHLRRTTVEALAAANGPLVIPAYCGRHGHPVRASRAIISELLALPWTAKASDVIHRHRAVFLDVDDPGVLYDIDTPADYEALVGERAEQP
jgi:molybdenum cofactor cytidylyltransferase